MSHVLKEIFEWLSAGDFMDVFIFLPHFNLKLDKKRKAATGNFRTIVLVLPLMHIDLHLANDE